MLINLSLFYMHALTFRFPCFSLSQHIAIFFRCRWSFTRHSEWKHKLYVTGRYQVETIRDLSIRFISNPEHKSRQALKSHERTQLLTGCPGYLYYRGHTLLFHLRTERKRQRLTITSSIMNIHLLRENSSHPLKSLGIS